MPTRDELRESNREWDSLSDEEKAARTRSFRTGAAVDRGLARVPGMLSGLSEYVGMEPSRGTDPMFHDPRNPAGTQNNFAMGPMAPRGGGDWRVEVGGGGISLGGGGSEFSTVPPAGAGFDEFGAGLPPASGDSLYAPNIASFARPDPLNPTTGPAGPSGGGGGFLSGIGDFITENPDLVTGLAGTAANVYGAERARAERQQERQARMKLDQDRLEEERRRREDDRLRMLMQGIAAFA